MLSCPGRAGSFVRVWLAAGPLCLSWAAFASFALHGQVIVIRADLGTGWLGRKRTECISWDGPLSGV